MRKSRFTDSQILGCEIASNLDPLESRNNSLIAQGNAPTGWGHVSSER